MGRVKYVITEIKQNDVKFCIENSSLEDQVFDLIPILSRSNNTINEMCKICLMSTDDIYNPLVNLCKCSGTMQFIHFQCVKQWIDTKLKIKENSKKTVSSYNIKGFNCEICRTPFPCNFFF